MITVIISSIQNRHVRQAQAHFWPFWIFDSSISDLTRTTEGIINFWLIQSEQNEMNLQSYN